MNEPSKLNLSQLEQLPDEVLLNVPKVVSEKTATEVMRLLVKTSRRFGIFQADADKMDAIRLIQHIGAGNYTAAERMLSRNPRLAITPIPTAKIPPVYEFLDFKNMSGGDVDVKVYGLDDGSGYTNACRVALSNLDTNEEDGMWQMMSRYLSEEESLKQERAIFPEGSQAYFDALKSYDYDKEFSLGEGKPTISLIQAFDEASDAEIQAVKNDEANDSSLRLALEKFREARIDLAKEEKIFNAKHGLRALEISVAKYRDGRVSGIINVAIYGTLLYLALTNDFLRRMPFKMYRRAF